MKGSINTVKIRNFEAKVLRENGFGYLVIGGHGTYKNLLLTENKRALQFLENYRKLIVRK